MPIIDSYEWQTWGVCSDAPPELAALFFHPYGKRGRERRERSAAAKRLCATCPVIRQCRTHALTTQEPYGTWGGMSEDELDRAYSERSDAC